MPVAYPSTLPLPIFGHTREQPAAFSVSQPRRGWGYVEPTGTDTPVFWSVTWRFTEAQAQVFRHWFVNTIARGVDSFLMTIRTEFGLVEHEMQFLPDSLLPARHLGGNVWEYSATVMARSLDGETPTDSLFSSVILLMHMDTAAFTDSSFYARVPTISGPTIDTGQKKFGAGAGVFAGGTVTFPDVSSLDLGAQAWCLEGWFYLTAHASSHAWLSHSSNYDSGYSNHEFMAYFTVTGKSSITVGVPGPAESVSTMGAGATCPLNAWFHLAICRGGTSSIQHYLNGVRDTTAGTGPTNDATALTASSSPLTVGGPGSNGLLDPFAGRCDDLRMTVGSRRYSGDSFTPPTMAHPDE